MLCSSGGEGKGRGRRTGKEEGWQRKGVEGSGVEGSGVEGRGGEGRGVLNWRAETTLAAVAGCEFGLDLVEALGGIADSLHGGQELEITHGGWERRIDEMLLYGHAYICDVFEKGLGKKREKNWGGTRGQEEKNKKMRRREKQKGEGFDTQRSKEKKKRRRNVTNNPSINPSWPFTLHNNRRHELMGTAGSLAVFASSTKQAPHPPSPQLGR